MQNLTEAAEKAAKSHVKLSVREQTQAMYNDYDKHVRLCIEDGLKKITGDFWIMTNIYKDPQIKTQNVLRMKYKACRACPTPTWMQNVYRYRRSSDELELLWAIPSFEACQHFQKNKEAIHPKDYCLLKYVLDFHSGALDLVCAQQNKEL